MLPTYKPLTKWCNKLCQNLTVLQNPGSQMVSLCISQLKPRPPRPPGHSGEFNIYPVLKDGLFPRPRGQETC